MFFPRGPHFPDSREMPLPVERMIALPPLHENAYQLRPPIQAGTYEHWTYFGSPFEEPGEYVYEIRVLPTGRHLTPSSAEPGWEVIAARGRLTVLAK
ncbi:MAG: hypothetical protein KDA69_09760 [Planctomycetaceae bacterium]|nr:hypothetical protein [Planctomycetaceae bacterium]